ncbi:MAG: DUF368 domain-containing protein [Candidatus Woesearchaeota archaeon]
MKFDFKLFLNGIIMGFADVLPGISGATVAVLLNFYEKFIHSWDYVVKNLFKKRMFSKELLFLANLYTGVLVGIFLFSKLMKIMLNNYKSEIYALIVGLIAISGLLIINKNKKIFKGIKNYYFMLLGLLAGVLTGIISLNINNHSNFILFISGFLAMCAMLLPGISGSYVLVMLNQYETVISLINELSLRFLYFIIGIALGLVVMIKIIKVLLKNYHKETLSFIIGLIFGGLYLPISFMKFNLSSIIFLLIGISVGLFTKKLE